MVTVAVLPHCAGISEGKMNKNGIYLCLTAALFLTAVCTACEPLYTIEELQYDDERNFTTQTVSGGGAVRITGYTGTKKALIIPRQIQNLPVTEIGGGAFSQKELTDVVIPDTVTSIGDSAFYENKLMSLTIPGSVTDIGGWAFYNNDLVYNLTIPGSVTSIGWSAFSNNILKSVNISGAAAIGSSAFSSNLLTSITISGSGASVDGFAFGINRITRITIAANVSILSYNYDAFDDNFADFYNANGCKAGTYILRNGNWVEE